MTNPLIRTGQQFLLHGADFDAADHYAFTVEAVEPDLVLRFKMVGCEDDAVVSVPSEALQNAPGVIKLSQGSFTSLLWNEAAKSRDYGTPAERDPNTVPSFMLTREQYRAASKGAVTLQPLWDFPDMDTFSVSERQTLSVDVHGQPTEVNVLVLQGTESTARLTVLDDPQWPLILSREECDGGNVEKISFTALAEA